MSTRFEVEGLTKGFGGVAAVRSVSFSVSGGTIVGLVGPNGAGKSTLFDCISGRQVPDGGVVRLDGRLLDPRDPARNARSGLGRTFQRVEVFPTLTVEDHLLVALRARHGSPRLWRDLARLSRRSAAEGTRIADTLAQVGLSEMAGAQVGTLGLGRCRLVELARALVLEPKVLLLDEASSGLEDREVDQVVTLLRQVARDRQVAVVAIEHDLDMVRRLADEVACMVDGALVATGSFAEVMANDVVIEAYLGTGRRG